MTDKTDSKEREALIRAITSMCHDMDNDKIVITRREGEGPALRQLLDAMQRELASFAANAGSEPVESNRPSLESVFRGLSDRAYCNYIEQMRRNECLGWEHKVKHGMFGEAELKAHTLAGRLLGRHHAFAEAANALRGSDVPLTHTSPPEGMVGGWIASKDQMPPPGVRVFWGDADSNRVGYDSWAGDDYRWTPSHWMHIPEFRAPPTSSADSGKGE